MGHKLKCAIREREHRSSTNGEEDPGSLDCTLERSMNEGGLIIEHPVLWSEERRRIENRKIANESLKLAKIRRERQRRNSLMDQQEVRNTNTFYM